MVVDATRNSLEVVFVDGFGNVHRTGSFRSVEECLIEASRFAGQPLCIDLTSLRPSEPDRRGLKGLTVINGVPL